MKKLGINFENVLTIAKEFNIDILSALYKVKNLGITSLDVKYDRVTGENNYIKEIISSGLTMESLWGFCPFNDKDNVQKAISMVDFAYSNNIKEIMFLSDFINGGYTEQDITNVKKNLRRVVKYASAYGVQINIENVGCLEFPFNDEITTLDVLKAVKGLGLVFDGGNFLLNDVKPIDCINSLAPYVSRYHLKDRIYGSSNSDFIEVTTKGENSYVTSVGDGECDCLAVLKVIKEYYNDVPLVIEFPAKETKLYDKLEKSTMYVLTEMMVWVLKKTLLI